MVDRILILSIAVVLCQLAGYRMTLGCMIGIFEEGWALADLWVFDLASKQWQEITVSPRSTARPQGRGYAVSEQPWLVYV